MKLADHAAAGAPGEPVEDEAEVVSRDKYRILLVEDIEINRMLAETILTESGFLVDSVEDGSDAVEAVKKHAAGYYDLILMDIQMPVMNGYEAAEAIRALENQELRSIPIIAMTANAFSEDVKKAQDAGMNAHIAKPINLNVMVGTLKDVLSSR